MIAYGCETVNESPDITYKNATAESNVFDGRYTMAKYLSEQKYSDSWNNQWNSYKGSGNNNPMKDPMQTCMSRNRDLNRDGKLTLDELRWYVPSYAQYNGLWIGEEALSTESRLYQGQTSELGTNSNYNTNKWMHYYTSTQGRETFWSEEGSCYGTGIYQTKHVKCIRNLQSNGTGVEDLNTALSSDVSVTPNKYYTYKTDNNTFDMSNVDEKCLRAVKQEQELGYHNEREPLNKVYNFFQVSIQEMSGYYGHNNVLNGKVVCYGQYDEAGTTGWRIPNQREISLMSLEDDDLQLKFNNDGVGCFARTAFSNQNYRSGYGFNKGALFLAQPNTTSQGTIRCVRDRNANDN